MKDLIAPDLEQSMRHAAKLAAAALEPTMKLCRKVEKAALAYQRAAPVPRTENAHTYAHNAARNAANRVADAVRDFEWIADGCPRAGEKE